jgi:hypothetical protein
MNKLTLKALLLDTCFFIKTGSHIAPNYKTAKKELCKQLGQKSNITALQLLNGLGLVFRDNNIENEFWQTIDKQQLTHLF